MKPLFFWLLAVAASALHLLGSDAIPAKVSANELKGWVSYLSSDEMKGRKNGSEEIERAAQWLAERFKELGLTPAPGSQSYFQEYEIEHKEEKFPAKNVIGWMEGDDPELKAEYIVLTGHYDHVGTNPELEGDTIFNGADDDASGVAAAMGVAASLGRLRGDGNFTLKRSLLVIAFSGEELRLLGSEHYTKHPLVPLEKMAVNLNFELVGHSEKNGRNKFFMSGQSYSDLFDYAKASAPAYGWELIDNPFPEMKLFFRSDNVRFALLEFDRENKTGMGIPAHAFSTWGGEEHYHQVFDEADRMDFENMAGFVRMMSGLAAKLANQPEWVQWKEGGDIAFRRPE